MTPAPSPSEAGVRAAARLLGVRVDAERCAPVASALAQLVPGLAAMDELAGLDGVEPSARFDPSWHQKSMAALAMQPCELTLAEASDSIGSGVLSPVELIESLLLRIDAVEPAVGAFATLAAQRARTEAGQAAAEITSGRRRGPLHGIPLAYKDLMNVAGLPTLAGSKVRAGAAPQRDSVVAARLRAAGAVALGKTHTHEFAVGVITRTTRNPWALDRAPGGSSGGSAAAVAARECPAAIGTDTGGRSGFRHRCAASSE